MIHSFASSRRYVKWKGYKHRVSQLSTLSYEQYGDNTLSKMKSAVFIHGMLGSKKNMRTPCREFMKSNPDYKCITVDVRGHGNSHNLGGEATIEECARDLEKLMKALDISCPDMIVAHSLSGKIVLKYLENRVGMNVDLPHNTWILDSLPGPYTHSETSQDSSQSVANVIKALDDLPMPLPSRAEVVKKLTGNGISLTIAQWLSTSLKQSKHGEGVEWVFDLKVAKQLFNNFVELDMRPFLRTYKGDSVIHFVRAGRSEKWSPDVLKFFDEVVNLQQWQANGSHKNIQLHLMPAAGHWLHSEDLAGLLNIINSKNVVPS